ncbi:hypothetical protein GQR58_014528 [Nymphon striatum]|nr:hypothetical protein GQR58_014528 [Nymphon striatum]
MAEASIDSSDEDIFQNYAGKKGIKPYRFEPKRRRLNVDQPGNVGSRVAPLTYLRIQKIEPKTHIIVLMYKCVLHTYSWSVMSPDNIRFLQFNKIEMTQLKINESGEPTCSVNGLISIKIILVENGRRKEKREADVPKINNNNKKRFNVRKFKDLKIRSKKSDQVLGFNEQRPSIVNETLCITLNVTCNASHVEYTSISASSGALLLRLLLGRFYQRNTMRRSHHCDQWITCSINVPKRPDLCSLHFEESRFDEIINMQAKLMGSRREKLCLKHDAVFLKQKLVGHPPSQKITPSYKPPKQQNWNEDNQK